MSLKALSHSWRRRECCHDQNRRCHEQKRRGISATALVLVIEYKPRVSPSSCPDPRRCRSSWAWRLWAREYFMIRTDAVTEIALRVYSFRRRFLSWNIPPRTRHRRARAVHPPAPVFHNKNQRQRLRFPYGSVHVVFDSYHDDKRAALWGDTEEFRGTSD
jgi:hypothetical protein